MDWLVRLWDEIAETPSPDVMPEAERQLASKIARVGPTTHFSGNRVYQDLKDYLRVFDPSSF